MKTYKYFTTTKSGKRLIPIEDLNKLHLYYKYWQPEIELTIGEAEQLFNLRSIKINNEK